MRKEYTFIKTKKGGIFIGPGLFDDKQIDIVIKGFTVSITKAQARKLSLALVQMTGKASTLVKDKFTQVEMQVSATAKGGIRFSACAEAVEVTETQARKVAQRLALLGLRHE